MSYFDDTGDKSPSEMLIENLPKATFSARGFGEIFYGVPIKQLKAFLTAVDVKLQEIDYFYYGGKEIQIPGTMTLRVVSDRTNTIPMSEGESVLGEKYLKYSIYLLKGEDGGIYAFGVNEIGVMFSYYWMESLFMNVCKKMN